MSPHRTTRLTVAAALLALLAAIGCSQQASSSGETVQVTEPAAVLPLKDSPAAAPPKVAAASPQPAVQQPPPKPAEPTEFKFPADTSGAAVAKVVTPGPPPLPANEPLGDAPKPRTPPARLLNPEPAQKFVSTVPPILPAKPASLKLVAPAERIPFDLGVRAEEVPQKPKLPEMPVVTAKARDVNLPPELPMLGRPLPDRASLEDPTTEAGNGVIVNRPVAVPLAPSGFLRLALPDPFELAEQVKPKIAPAAEPNNAPVPVTPERPQ